MEYVLYYLFIYLLIPTAQYVKYKNNVNNILYLGMYFPKYKSNIFLGVCILIYSILLGIAYNTGQDYWHYYDHYSSELKNAYDLWGSGREVGYRWLISLLSSIFSSHVSFFILCAFLNAYVWNKVCSLYGKAASYIMFMWYLFMFPLSLNLYRQYIAMAILMYSYYIFFIHYDSNKKLSKWNLLVVALLCIAFFFHTSSIIGSFMFIVCFLLRTVRINKIFVIIIIIAVTVSANTVLRDLFNYVNTIVLLSQDVTGKGYEFEGMLDSVWDESRMQYVVMIIHLIYVWYADKFLKSNPHLNFLYVAMILCFILIPITQQEILLRIRIYLENIMTIAIGILAYYYFSYKKISLRTFPLLLAFTINCIYAFYNLYNLGQDFPLEFKV